MKAEHKKTTVCNAANDKNGQEMPENMIYLPEYDEWIENPFTPEEIAAAKSIDDLFCLKRVDEDD